MGVVKFEQVTEKKSIYEVGEGEFFLGQYSGEVFVKSQNGGTRLHDGDYWTDESLSSWGPVYVLPKGSKITTIV